MQSQKTEKITIIRRLMASAQSGEPVPLDDAFKAIERIHRQRMTSLPIFGQSDDCDPLA